MIFPKTALAPDPGEGHYSQCVVHGGLVFVSGLLPLDPVTRELVSEEFEAQAHRVLLSLKAILENAGSSPDRLLKVNVYITDLEDWSRFNTIYREYLGEHRPARAVVTCPALHFGAKIEVDAISAV